MALTLDPYPPDRTPAWAALAVAIVILLVASALRDSLNIAALLGETFGRTIDITLLYAILLAPAAVAAALHPSRWLLIGVLAAYLGEITRVWLHVATLMMTTGAALPSDIFWNPLLHAVPNAMIGVGGAALGLIVAKRNAPSRV